MTKPTIIGSETAGRIDAEACYLAYGPMVLRRCRHLLRDEERARDAMHDVFVQVLRYRDQLDQSAPSSLLYRIATNVCLNQLRTARRRPEVPDDAAVERTPDAGDAENAIASRSVLARLFGADLGSIAPIAALRYRDGLSVDEVAREVGMSATSVRKRLHRLRAALPALAA